MILLLVKLFLMQSVILLMLNECFKVINIDLYDSSSLNTLVRNTFDANLSLMLLNNNC